MIRRILCLCLGLAAFFAAAGSDRSDNDILVISSLNMNEPWSGRVYRAVDSTFSREGYEISAEELQIPMMKTEAEADSCRLALSRKYARPPGLVVFIGDPSWVLCRPLFDSIWRDVPSLICFSRNEYLSDQVSDVLGRNGMSEQPVNSAPDMLTKYNVTALTCPVYIDRTLGLMKRLLPGMGRVVFISDERYISRVTRQEVKQAMEERFPELTLDVMTSSSMTTEQLLDSLSGFDRSTGVIYYSWFNMENPHKNYLDDKLQKIIYAFCVPPVFSLTEMGTAEGDFAGGVMIDSQDFVDATLATVRKILGGTPAREIPSQAGGSPQAILNYHHLLHHGVDVSLIPGDAVSYQGPESFLDHYRLHIISGLCIVALLGIILLMRLRFLSHKQVQLSRYRLLVNNMPAIYIHKQLILDNQGNISDFIFRDVNTAFERTFGISRKSVLDHRYSELITEYPVLQNLTGKHIGKNTSFTVPDTKGGELFFEKLIFGGSGPEELDVFCIDKTEAHRAGMEADQYRHFLEVVLDSLPVATKVKDIRDGMKYIFWNRKAEELYGHPAGEIIGRTDEVFMDPDMVHMIAEEDEELVRTGLPLAGIMKYTQDGKEYALYRNKTLVRYSGGREWLVCSAWDITEMQHTREQLEELNGKYRLVSQATKLMLWTWDLETGKIEYNTENMIDRGDYDEDMMIFEDKHLFSLLDKQTQGYFGEGLASIREGQSEVLHLQFPIRPYPKEPSRELWIECFAVVSVRDDQGRPQVLVGASSDITERKMLERELTTAKEKAEESNLLKSAFLANMSHEIRTPLNAIVGFSGVLAQTQDEQEKQEYVNIIESNNTLLLQLIGDILDLSKIEAGTLEFTPSEVELKGVIEEVWQSARMRLRRDTVAIECDPGLTELRVYTDRNRVMQVVTNFVNNALKFTDEGTIRLGYRLQDDGYVRVHVSDTGCGIPGEMQKKIFGRFVKLNSFVQGTGLGLSICESIVTKLGGEIGVDSCVGEGSTFWFTIPYRQQTPESEPESQEESVSPTDTSGIPAEVRPAEERPTILIAEDDPSNYKLFESILGREYELVHAWDGEQAVELFTKHDPRLILMDIKMPGLDGYGATARIRELSCKVPIIAVTAYAFGEDESRILRSGFNAYASKPIMARELKGKIASMLGGS